MSRQKCPVCKGGMIRYGNTKAGSRRWQCPSCKATSARRIDNAAKLLAAFLGWLLSGRRQADMPGGGRTFRRRCARLWEVWPIAPVTGEVHRAVFADGIYLARNAAVLIAASEDFVIGWYMARSESSRPWGALMAKIPPPEVVVTDGGPGFERARKRHWLQTRVQRCVFHAFNQVGRQTTTRPKLQAGVGLYGLARELPHVKTADSATAWLLAYSGWCGRWEDFLAERTLNAETGEMGWTHERLVTARNGLNTLVGRGRPFTFLDPEPTADGPLPPTNNKLEGGVSAQLRDMLRGHRGLSLMRRAKAVSWWCCMHTECPLGAAEILATMPTDEDIVELYRQTAYEPQKREGPAEWGDGPVWAELRHALPWRIEWE